MGKIMDFIRSEPVRVILYPLLIALVVYLVKDTETADTIIGIVAAVLGIAGTEVARHNVTPMSKVHHEDAGPAVA